MALSFGFDSKIVNSPFYNLGYCLPFFCAFYVMNAPGAFLLPFGFEVGGELASLLHIVTATFFYFLFVLFAALASHFSEMIEQSKAWLIYVAIICFLSLYSIIFNASQPKVSIYFTILSAIILLSYIVVK